MASSMLSDLQVARTVSARFKRAQPPLYPYVGGNGPQVRFLINAASASDGYPLLLICMRNSSCYSNAADRTGIDRDIGWFAGVTALQVDRADRARQAGGRR